MKTPDEITVVRISRDINGNSRYVVHERDITTTEEKAELLNKYRPGRMVRERLRLAAQKSRKLGGKIYRGKQFANHIVFQTTDPDQLRKDIADIVNDTSH